MTVVLAADGVHEMRDRWRRCPAELARAAGTREPDRRAMAITPDQRRALQMLAGSPHGCTEAIMLAHGFTDQILGRLVLNGLASSNKPSRS
jgi:hypothetical protein